MLIGYVIGESTTTWTTILLKEKVREGSYVVLEYDGIKALGILTSITSGSSMIDDKMGDIALLDRLANADSAKIPRFIKGKVRLLVDLTDLKRVTIPPPPLTPARTATDDELRDVYSRGTLTIGKVLGSDVEAKIDVNALTRHLAILAATGAGKSNTVAVLSTRISEMGGTVVIFDYHGEYTSLNREKVHLIEPKLNPLNLSPKEFAIMLNIRGNAHIQYRIFRRAFEALKDEIREKLASGGLDLKELNEKLPSMLTDKVEDMSKESEKKKGDSVQEVMNKIEEFFEEYGQVIDLSAPDVVDNVRRGYVNVVDLSPLDEDAMDALVSHYLRRFLVARKENKRTGGGLKFPVITVLEEAHVLLSKDDNKLTKLWASRIAREGRKFGVHLVIVSQRPKGLDENILSQMINKIILKLVEPTDKKYVLETSDNLSEDMVEQLSAFNPGEALVIGPIVRLPMIVKIDKYGGELAGRDPNLLEEWRKALDEENVQRQALEW